MMGYLKKLLIDKFIRNVAVLAGGTLLSQILILVTLPLLTRLYTPAEYGTYSMYVSLIGMLLMLVSCAYEYAITLPEDDRVASELVRLCLLICVGMSLLVFIMMGLLQHPLARWLGEPDLPGYYALFAISMLGAGFYQILSTWSVRKKHFRRLSRTKYTQSIGQVGGQLAFSQTGIGAVGLIAGDILGRCGGLIPMWRQWREDLKKQGSYDVETSAEARSADMGEAQQDRALNFGGAGQQLVWLTIGGALQIEETSRSSFLPRASSRLWKYRRQRRLLFQIRNQMGGLKAAMKGGGLKEVAWRYRRFPQLSLASNVLNSIGIYLPTVLLASFYGAHVAGWFALGQRVLGSPMTLLVSAVRSVYLAESSEYMQKDPARLVPLFRRTVLQVLVAGAAIIVLVVGIAPLVFGPLFGEQWTESADFIRLMSVMYLGQFVANAVGTTIDVMERQDLHLLREVIRTAMILGAVLGAYYTGQNASTAVLLFSAASTAGYLLHLGLSWVSVRKYAAEKREEAGIMRTEKEGSSC